MNGLTLRISRGGGKKTKNPIGFSPVNITTSIFGGAVLTNKLLVKFSEETSVDGQLTFLKNILEEYKNDINNKLVQFMVVVFLHAEAKHPVKCLITRHVIKNNDLQEPFTNELAAKITSLISPTQPDIEQYVSVVSKVVTCIENFNTGVAAVRLVDIKLASYLNTCVNYCVQSLCHSKLSPTEKNEIFNLTHLSLRLLLHIIQKAPIDNNSSLTHMFSGIRYTIQQLMFDDDAPMDTKSVCGIVYLSMHVTENGPDSWVDILSPPTTNYGLVKLLESFSCQLCVYSAIVTVVPADRLQTPVNASPAVIVLMNNILRIGERSSSESMFTLGVARTLLQISKLLDKLTDKAIGRSIVEALLVFCWSHLDHYMDSVRHITAQILGTIVTYCAKLERDGDSTALKKLLNALKYLDTSRKSYFVSVTCVVNELGSSPVLAMWPNIIPVALQALSSQHVQASATTALERLARSCVSCGADELQARWVAPLLAHVRDSVLDSSVLNILENLLVQLVDANPQLMDYILPHMKPTNAAKDRSRDLKCVLMLMSVARKSHVTHKQTDTQWKGIIDYQVLKEAAVDASDETRILSLSLVVESLKSTEQFTEADLSFILHYLKYNINAQAPNYRQLTLSLMKKFIKRLEDSYKVIKRQTRNNGASDEVHYYLRFVEQLRELCFGSLAPAAAYSRRRVALSLLADCSAAHLEGYHSNWKCEYVEKLLLHLEDSYENNKLLALQLLETCPVDLVKNNKYSISMELEDILSQASSPKPTDCVSATYKLDYLRRNMADCLPQLSPIPDAEPVTYNLIRILLQRLRGELSVCMSSVVMAARSAPMYGIIHCISHLLDTVNPIAISSEELWTGLISDLIDISTYANSAVACVVNNSSPEGHLPCDMSGVQLTDHGNSGGVVLADGRQVTAQMVLLCAWRCVKEVSLLLGLITSRFTISGEESETGTLSENQLIDIGSEFTTLLAETKHRGAFEQAYVGFTKLLSRLWRCHSASLHNLPKQWLTKLTRAIESDQWDTTTMCATRRSAGLPFMIQALVSTEIQHGAQGRASCFRHCVTSLMRSAGAAGAAVTSRSDRRCHALNVLRALFRNSTLSDAMSRYVEDAIIVALDGFDSPTWAERNSSTLLFAALMTRVFGVTRGRDVDTLCVRNRMTGRIFFLRYPQLYDFMLMKLKEVSASKTSQLLRPSLYPVLLLLARLYPSSLEGTVSNLKLVAFIPHVVSCAGSSVLNTRQLAAKAMVALVSPEQYIPHIESMFELVSVEAPRNLCHGVLLQLWRLMHAPPERAGSVAGGVAGDVAAGVAAGVADTAARRLQHCVQRTLWLLQQAVADKPCYPIADEYIKVISAMAWRFPYLVEKSIDKIISLLDTLIFNSRRAQISSGREVCLANAIYLLFILEHNDTRNARAICRGLQHDSYEVVLATLNYLLILHDNFDEHKDKLLEHLSLIANKRVLHTLNNDKTYIQLLCKVLNNEYLECQEKSLRILTLEGDTERFIIETKTQQNVSDETIIEKLFECVENEHERLTHVYLESLLNFVTKKLMEINVDVLLHVLKVVIEHSFSDNSEITRTVVVTFIERNIRTLLNFNIGLSAEVKFELKATTWCTIITLLEDDEAILRQRISDALTSQLLKTSRVVGAACAERIRDFIERDEDGAALFVLIALFDFKSVVVSDDGNDECRVFDQNEKYNTFLEETMWTSACADKIISLSTDDTRPLSNVLNIIGNPVYKKTLDRLCNDNIVMFKKLAMGPRMCVDTENLNPKIDLFINKLKCGLA